MGATITGGTLVMGEASNPHTFLLPSTIAWVWRYFNLSDSKIMGKVFWHLDLGIYAFEIKFNRFWKELGLDEMNLDHPGLWTAVESMRRKKLIADGSVQPSLLYLPAWLCLRHQRWVVPSSPPPSYRPPTPHPTWYRPHPLQFSYTSYLVTSL